MTTRPIKAITSLMLAGALLAWSPGPGAAQTRQLSDDQIKTIELHYKLDQYMVGGCLLGATFGAVTGLMTMAGMSVIAAVPYISTGCSLGFLIGPASMIIRDYLSTPPGHHDTLGWHWPASKD